MARVNSDQFRTRVGKGMIWTKNGTKAKGKVTTFWGKGKGGFRT